MRGAPARRTSPGRRSFTVLFAGDWAPIRAFESLAVADPAFLFGELFGSLRAADLCIVNCECALAEAGQPVWKSGSVFRGRPAHARALAAVPFHVACLANNHVLDYGREALGETLAALRGSGIRALGAGLSEEEAWAPLSLELGGTRVSLVNFCEGEDLSAARGGPGVAGWEIPRVCELVRRLKARGDCVLAVAHAGLEFVPFPPPYLQRACRAVIEAGADCVVGHHAHVPQGIELHLGRPIAYSLGNFLFYQPTDLYWRKIGFLLELEVASGRVRGFRTRPYRIGEAGLRALGLQEQAEFNAALEALSRPLLQPGGCEQAWEAFLEYYGAEGLGRELGSILEALRDQPPKGAAMLRNRLATPQHAELWRDLLARIVTGGPPAREDLAARVREWFERRIPPAQPSPASPPPQEAGRP